MITSLSILSLYSFIELLCGKHEVFVSMKMKVL